MGTTVEWVPEPAAEALARAYRCGAPVVAVEVVAAVAHMGGWAIMTRATTTVEIVTVNVAYKDGSADVVGWVCDVKEWRSTPRARACSERLGASHRVGESLLRHHAVNVWQGVRTCVNRVLACDRWPLSLRQPL